MTLVHSEVFPNITATLEDFSDDAPKTHTAKPFAAEKLSATIAGVKITLLMPNEDSRGTLTEFSHFNLADEPIVHVYQVMAKPGSVRAWVYHKRQYDRLSYTNGNFELVLFDLRRDSPTRGMLNVFHVGEQNRCAVRIPPFVVHGLKNIGTEAATFVNMPTRRYDPAHPDKSRLPVDDPRIPYRFDER